MKRILISHTVLIFILSISINLISAQINYNSPWVKSAGVSVNEKINFQDVVDAGNLYWEINDKNAKGSGYKPFKRWEAFWENYVDEMGFLPSGKELWDTWKSKNSASQLRTSMNSFNDQSNWSSIGPTDFLNRSTSYLNLGRVNCVTPDPVNPNIVYVGTPSGGIWKSEDGGLTYVDLSDNLPQIGVSSIVIDYTNDSSGPLESKLPKAESGSSTARRCNAHGRVGIISSYADGQVSRQQSPSQGKRSACMA